ncbi:unnamed protein product [Larinioides sclopetarius]|uniref:Uncharacterized protein n=1 Tax=Larinioides sclopetarius TaxID=280406 RepID=A0AAV2AAG6_9ARAC
MFSMTRFGSRWIFPSIHHPRILNHNHVLGCPSLYNNVAVEEYLMTQFMELVALFSVTYASIHNCCIV